MIDRQPKKKHDPETAALMSEVYEALRPQSVFWSVDHPTEAYMNRAPAPDLKTTSLLDGCKESLAGAERMERAALAKLNDIPRVAARVRGSMREELWPWVDEMLKAVFICDLRRARDEARHWREYVEHYSRQNGQPVKFENAFTPPWAGEEINTEGEDKF